MEPAFSTHSNPLLCSTNGDEHEARFNIPRKTMPKKQISTDAAVNIVKDKLKQDATPKLNLATFVTSAMEPECEEIMLESMNKNFANAFEYPGTAEMERSCVNMLANLYHAPLGESDEAVGVATVGSSEGAMLAGLAFKTKWQNSRKAKGELISNPSIVIGSNLQVCWKKFARYFEVDLKEVKVREGYYVMDPYKAVEMVDDHTICVVSILGSTYNGEFEDVKLLNELLEQKNKEKGWNVPIHVDAASGGFIAPFCEPELEWDFRLPLVKSINVSGHKYGLVYPGVGWTIWRTKEDLPEDLTFHYSLFGAEQSTITLNMSKSSSQIIAQYYQMIRLGHEGYRNLMQTCRQNAKVITEGLQKIGGLNIISKDTGIPMVVFNLREKTSSNEYELCDKLCQFGWIIRAYPMPPGAEHVTAVRIVVRPDLSRALVEKLLLDIAKVISK